MAKEVLDILNRIALERNIPVHTLHDALEAALISASKKMLPPEVEVVEAELDRETGEFRIYANMEVVEELEDENTQILLEEAREYVEDVSIGEQLVIDVTPEDFGRIAAQSAKQVITQRIREAEREMIFDRYKNRAGDLVAGTVQRYEKGSVIVDLGNAEALLPSREQPQGERYRYGERLKAVILDIRKSSKDAQIILSRTTPLLVTKLFEQEVAEIRDGIVTIRLVAREPGRRTKIAVLSSDSDVDPVGACVGMKGSRVQMVVQELRGERIDIIEYSDDKRRFVANSLKPANIESVELDEKKNRASLVVRDEDLALAIGKNGLNAKLASELTGVEIDIITDSQINAREAEARRELYRIPVLRDNVRLVDSFLVRGLIHCSDVIKAGVEELSSIEGVDEELAQLIYQEAEEIANAPKNAGEPTISTQTESDSSEPLKDDLIKDENHVDSEIEDNPAERENAQEDVAEEGAPSLAETSASVQDDALKNEAPLEMEPTEETEETEENAQSAK